MISVSGKKWEQKKINQNLVDKLKQDFNFSDNLSRLIISRKFEVDEIATINTDLDLNNVFLNNEDFNKSIKLVVDCINKAPLLRLLPFDYFSLLLDELTLIVVYLVQLCLLYHGIELIGLPLKQFLVLSPLEVPLWYVHVSGLKAHYSIDEHVEGFW